MTFLVLALSDRADMREVSWPIMSQYCKRYGYEFITRTEATDKTRHISWNKIGLAQACMKERPEAEALVWFDDDLILTRPDLRLQDLFRDFLASDALLAVSEDAHGEPFNCGLICFKNTPAAADLLQRLYDSIREDNRWGLYWEQTALKRLYEADEAVRRAIHIYPPGVLQGFFRSCDPEPYRWRFGTFAAHVSCWNNRVGIMQYLAQHFSYDDEKIRELMGLNTAG